PVNGTMNNYLESKMERLPEISRQRLTDLSSESAISTDHLIFAAQRAKLLFGCFRKGDANDPETYTAAVTAILAEYPQEVIRYVTDPRTGIPRKSKFMPNPAEVAEACDAAKISLKAEEKITELGWKWTNGKWEKIAYPPI